jgi:Tfp pilus assembly protein PilF
MHRFAIPALLLASLALISADPKPAAKTPLSEPRQRLLKGNVAEARSEFEKLLGDAKHGPAAAIGIANSWRQTGEYAKARTAFDDAVKRFPGIADVLAARGDLLYDLPSPTPTPR